MRNRTNNAKGASRVRSNKNKKCPLSFEVKKWAKVNVSRLLKYGRSAAELKKSEITLILFYYYCYHFNLFNYIPS